MERGVGSRRGAALLLLTLSLSHLLSPLSQGQGHEARWVFGRRGRGPPRTKEGQGWGQQR